MRLVAVMAFTVGCACVPAAAPAQSLPGKPDPHADEQRRAAYEQGRRDEQQHEQAQAGRPESERPDRRRPDELQDGLHQDGRFNHDDRRGNDDAGYRDR